MRRGSDVEDGASEEPQPRGKELRNRSKKTTFADVRMGNRGVLERE
jgi:hypothetical protein